MKRRLDFLVQIMVNTSVIGLAHRGEARPVYQIHIMDTFEPSAEHVGFAGDQ